MKKCPFCAEEIQDEAVKCRWCGEFLKRRKKWLSCFLGCLAFSVLSLLATVIFVYLVFFLLKLVMYKIFTGRPSLPYLPPFFGIFPN